MKENYMPEDIQFVLDDKAREEFPLELDFINAVDDLNDKKDCMRYVGRNFTATFPEGEYVTRYMDDYEKSTLRGDYCQLVENILPDRKRQLEEALEEAKRLKKEAEELYSSTLQEINMMAAEVKQGTTETKLRGTDTFCIAIAGYYLYYTWSEKKNLFVLAKATEVADGSLWSSDEKNREQMMELFGAEFPENETREVEDADF